MIYTFFKFICFFTGLLKLLEKCEFLKCFLCEISSVCSFYKLNVELGSSPEETWLECRDYMFEV